ncbi:MAG: hypothetical protein FRX49_05620 [Trebouxia sp. A1-2]|nr:MAG: hypothetical protein FRX49_05620 [Trebouxia sp. A1-2]
MVDKADTPPGFAKPSVLLPNSPWAPPHKEPGPPLKGTMKGSNLWAGSSWAVRRGPAGAKLPSALASGPLGLSGARWRCSLANDTGWSHKLGSTATPAASRYLLGCGHWDYDIAEDKAMMRCFGSATLQALLAEPDADCQPHLAKALACSAAQHPLHHMYSLEQQNEIANASCLQKVLAALAGCHSEAGNGVVGVAESGLADGQA